MRQQLNIPRGDDIATLEAGEGSSKKTVSIEEDRELLKIIKNSDYKVVDQLNRTPSKISISSLLMTSEAHRTALLKFLNEEYMAEDISINQFDNVIANLSVSRCLMFTNDDLQPNGREHNMALHISIKCANDTLYQVLVDTLYQACL